MLKDKLYSISSLKTQEEGVYVAEVSLNPSHVIFKGHFPEQPILPGVCLMEMVKEIVMEIKHRPYRLTSASNMKFLRLVDPDKDPDLKITIAFEDEKENELKVNVNSFLQDGSPNFKLKGTFA